MSTNTSVAYFMTGTRIATDHNEVAMEHPQIGDTVKMTISGTPADQSEPYRNSTNRNRFCCITAT
jgi:hypothetical protein